MYFVEEVWAATPKSTVARSFRSRDISNALDGSGKGGLHDGLADVEAMAPEQGDRDGLQVECCSLVLTRRRLLMLLRAIANIGKILGTSARHFFVGWTFSWPSWILVPLWHSAQSLNFAGNLELPTGGACSEFYGTSFQLVGTPLQQQADTSKQKQKRKKQTRNKSKPTKKH